jgi:hypothetical protein
MNGQARARGDAEGAMKGKLFVVARSLMARILRRCSLMLERGALRRLRLTWLRAQKEPDKYLDSLLCL